MVVEAVDEPAVAARRAEPALVALEHDDADPGAGADQVPRRPQARVPAADDDDVGVGVAVQGGRRLAAELGVRERLAQPPAGVGDVGHGCMVPDRDLAGLARAGHHRAMSNSTAHPTRVAVVGVGNVGATFAYTLLLSGLASEIVLIDANRQRAEGEATDLTHAVPFSRPTRVWAGDYADCAGAAVTVITAGAAQRPGEDRLALVKRNDGIFGQIVPSVAAANPDGIIVVATNPVDVLAYRTWQRSGLPPDAGHRVGHHPGHGPLPVPARRALRRRPAVRPRLHRRRARRHRGAGLVVGVDRRDAPARTTASPTTSRTTRPPCTRSSSTRATRRTGSSSRRARPTTRSRPA